jgi:hypothetical protein
MSGMLESRIAMDGNHVFFSRSGESEGIEKGIGTDDVAGLKIKGSKNTVRSAPDVSSFVIEAPSMQGVYHWTADRLSRTSLSRLKEISTAVQLKQDDGLCVDAAALILIHSAIHPDNLQEMPWYYLPWL